MNNTFALIEKIKNKKLLNTLETLKSVSYMFAIGLCIASMYVFLKAMAYNNLFAYILGTLFLLFSLFFIIYPSFDTVKTLFFPNKKYRNKIIGTLTLEDTEMIISNDGEESITFSYYDIDRIDIYYYKGLKPTKKKFDSVFLTMEVMHIRVYIYDCFTHLYVENYSLNENKLGALFSRIEEIEYSDEDFFRKIKFWSDFKGE
jgi:hypothetical protein